MICIACLSFFSLSRRSRSCLIPASHSSTSPILALFTQEPRQDCPAHFHLHLYTENLMLIAKHIYVEKEKIHLENKKRECGFPHTAFLIASCDWLCLMWFPSTRWGQCKATSERMMAALWVWTLLSTTSTWSSMPLSKHQIIMDNEFISIHFISVISVNSEQPFKVIHRKQRWAESSLGK